MKCASCGFVLDKNAKFCTKCGAEVVQGNEQPRFAHPPQQYQGPKKLYRSRQNRLVGGVAGGMAEYFDMDPTLIRFLWILFTLAGGAGVLLYLIMLVIVPESPYDPWGEPDKQY